MSIQNKEGFTFQEWLYASGIATDQHYKAWENGEDPSEWKPAQDTRSRDALAVTLATGKKVKVPARIIDVCDMRDGWSTRGVARTNMRVVLTAEGVCMGWLND